MLYSGRPTAELKYENAQIEHPYFDENFDQLLEEQLIQ